MCTRYNIITPLARTPAKINHRPTDRGEITRFTRNFYYLFRGEIYTLDCVARRTSRVGPSIGRTRAAAEQIETADETVQHSHYWSFTDGPR